MGSLSKTPRRVFAAAQIFLVGLVLALVPACEGQVAVVHKLSELEANEILVVLGSQGIRGMKRAEEGRLVTYAIAVSESDRADALQILVANQLPKERSNGLKEVYPPGSSGLIPTRSEEKAKFLMAIQGEVERKLKAVPGVRMAHVSVVMPDKEVIRDIDEKPPEATASVALVYNLDASGKKPLMLQEVKDLVAASIEDLDPKNVQVIMKENRAMTVVDASGGKRPGGVSLAGETVLGIKVVDKKAGVKAKIYLGLFGALAVIGILLGLVGIIRSLSLRSKLSKAEAEVASMKKARQQQLG